ncbi:MAG TPA: APC family permease, partial [Nitrolancea sp.]|nr:APC family permease [Nitrolancea sp.]
MSNGNVPVDLVTDDLEAPRAGNGASRAGFEWQEVKQGRHPGDRYVRITREGNVGAAAAPPQNRVIHGEHADSRGSLGKSVHAVRRALLGRPIPTERESHERLSKLKALAVFASDNISSSAYATEEIMRILVLAGIGALAWTLPLTLVIILVLVVVVMSYQQTLRAYPSGGGSYIVASDNLGSLAGLIAAAALMIDYVLTVSVSIAAGVAAVTSIFPRLFTLRVEIAVGFVILLALGNLRGIRESGSIFAAPTYVYLFAIFGLLGYGLLRYALGTLPTYTATASAVPGTGVETLGLLLILRAFSSGAVALTGVEAVSNGIPAFKPPESHNARVVLIVMGTLFGTLFLGMSFLVTHIGIVPDPTEKETVLNQLAVSLVGQGSPYHYLVQFSTALILVLAANTAFADFPRLASILGSDRFLPRQLQYRGDRLAFDTGIIFLAVVASVLVVVFHGSVTALIPLYTVGVFIAFSLSQSGMVRHWWKLRADDHLWWVRALFNGFGALATMVVAVVVGIAKFALGAWLVLLLIPIFVILMVLIHRHYTTLTKELQAEPGEEILSRALIPTVVVPISRLDRPGLTAVNFAQSLSSDITIVHIVENQAEAEEFRSQWNAFGFAVPLVIVESPYRRLIGPLLEFIDEIDEHDPQRPITVILAEFVPRHWWENILHNLTAWRL